MEEKITNSDSANQAQSVECTKCHKQVPATRGEKTEKGFVCSECITKQKKRKHNIIVGSCVALLVAASVCGGVYMSSSDSTKTGESFDGVSQINDSMNLYVDSADVNFDLSSATAVSSPVSTQAPVSNFAEFKNLVQKNVSQAGKSKDKSIVIPTVASLFDINTNYLVSGSENIVKELADIYLKTDKKAIVLVEGFTCDLGGKELNEKLSKLRAETIKNILVDAGIPSENIETKWYGKSKFGEFNYQNKSDYRRVIVSIK